MTLETTAAQGAWFLLAALPVGLWVAWTDLTEMKIRNAAVLTLAGGFVLLGLIALPFETYLWRYLHLAVVLALGIAANALRLLGAGDAKFAAAAAPYIAPGDLGLLLWIYIAVFLAAFALHRAARASPLRRAFSGWASWTSGRRFPMGLALGPTLIAYCILAITGLPRA